MIVSLHITHLSAGLESLDGAIKTIHSMSDDVALDIEGVQEFVILNTCNRFEIYVGTEEPEKVIAGLEDLVKSRIPFHKDGSKWYLLMNGESVNHLFKVVCGLDSLIIGEDQIQHQVKNAYLKAVKDEHVKGRLHALFKKAIFVGKRVRTETSLNNGGVSLGSAAVELAEGFFGSLHKKSVVVLGAGEMATLIAKNLIGKDLKTVFVSNRTYENAVELAYQLEGVAVNLDLLPEVIRSCDIVLVATGAPHIILDYSRVSKAVEFRIKPLLIIDVSMPSNVDSDIADLDNVVLCRMDSLQQIALKNISKRKQEIIEAEKIILEELDRFESERKEKFAVQIISDLSQKMDGIRFQELQRASHRLDSNPDLKNVFEDFSNALISRIMADPFSKLKEASRNGDLGICQAAQFIFNLEV